MNSDELRSFLADPVAMLGNWVFDFTLGGGTAGTTRTVRLASVGEDATFVEYPAATNRPTLYLSKNTDRRRFMVTTTAPDRQFQSRSGYFLPWASNKAYYMTLGDHVDFFVTARLNGCCVMIAGPRATPTVVHANCASEEVDRIDPSIKGAVAIGQALDKQRQKVYDKYYWDVMGRLQGLDILSNQHPVFLFDPGTYGAIGTGSARVYGLRTDAGWTFYANVELDQKEGGNVIADNRRIWPA